ncbi:hypothetical protein EU538_04335 [Candidatus Thorarchaeota archaeon]|jgi:hypothetical protein|nr:MAG: hypothetical protein EU538_04335 [Candidatus Thorarchaeota archaeon]
MAEAKDVVLEGFLEEARQARFVLARAERASLSYAPSGNLRELRDLANHLAQIPRIDTAIYSGEVERVEDAQALEKNLTSDSVSEMVTVFDKGLEHVKSFFQDMSEEEFVESKLRPFYQAEGYRAWSECLQEMTSHLAMHKMQVWMYLRISGEHVDMYTYYGAES